MRCSLILLFALETCVSGQVRSQIIGSTYTLPGPFFDAPGQLLTLIVQSLDSSITKTVLAPGGTDLPTSLAGISATLTQLTRPSGIYSQHAPILEVRPYSPCNSDLIFECVNLLAITVQIPFDAPLGLSQSPSDHDISGTVGIAGSGDSGDNCCGYGK